MTFSQRTNWNTEESALARAHRTRVQAGLPVADLTASNPTRCGFSYDVQLLAALTDAKALDYDPQPLGLLHTREAVCKYYADHGVTIPPERVVLTTSTSEAYSFLFKLLCDPGSEIVVPLPGYPLFDFLAVLDDVRVKAVRLVYDHGWQIEPEGFRRALTPETRAIVLVHPNNPTGHFTKTWEAEELAMMCRERGIALIVDEVFLDYAFSAEKAVSFAVGLEGIDLYVVSGLSKIAGLPQMKAAWVVATGPNAGQAMERLEVIADTFLSMNAPVQGAIPNWIAGRKAIQREIGERVKANLAVLDKQLGAIPAVRRLEVEGGWYAVLRIPALQTDEMTVLRLLERGVWVHPGYFFGMDEAGWLVISLLGPVEEFRTGVRVLVDYFRTHQGDNNCLPEVEAQL
ncbi:pyridoxal phosphate-dependent aminotransferase [Telmatobacter sp. DSM 110680]|uniref:Pyridoxal phosphate-dependent aminotransferase n=1 Tax=Telmatobacter sp. DSM 110680 TaxID=3036704 RepID=A0AAU7DE04_9BACT